MRYKHFSYLMHVTLLTLAQARLKSLLRIRSGWLTFTYSNYHFRQPAPQPANCFNSSRGGLELFPYIKMGKMYPIFKQSLCSRITVPNC